MEESCNIMHLPCQAKNGSFNTPYLFKLFTPLDDRTTTGRLYITDETSPQYISRITTTALLLFSFFSSPEFFGSLRALVWVCLLVDKHGAVRKYTIIYVQLSNNHLIGITSRF